jgi:hypothetical protein
LALRPYRDRTVCSDASPTGPPEQLTDDDRRAAAMAADLKAALRAKAAGRVVGFNANPVPDDAEIFDGCAGNDLTSEAAWLARVARAYAGHRG